MKKRSTSGGAKRVSSKRKKSVVRMPVAVQVGRQPSVLQPGEKFRVCPLGVQFYSPTKLADFAVMDFQMQVAQTGAAPATVSCSGVVVHCQKEKDSSLYRVWVKFMDLAKEASANIKCAAKSADAICPHCENF
jgi:hypothetical protein